MPLADIDIARQTPLPPIIDTARERLGLAATDLIPYGHDKAKLSWPLIESLAQRPAEKAGRLVLVTAISPTPAGEGKTTTTIGLGDALQRAGRRTVVALREPSLGPVFGLKGGATGGGRSQVAPMEDINLHFTGDFHAVAAAHNLLAAAIDNHVHHGNRLGIDTRRVAWKRVLDMNDRALRHVTVGLGGPANGFVREDGFDIVVASEVMAILCLAESLQDLKARLSRIVVAHNARGEPVTAADLQVHGAMAVLLKQALLPNLVQTLEQTPALVHGGPFANIAHGCNSLLATRAAMRLADFVVTEAGFGADLGAEKFIDIKCRMSGLQPACAVVVATVRGLKYHGGAALATLAQDNPQALQAGIANLERHLHNLHSVFGLRCVVAINHFAADTEAEHRWVQQRVAALGHTAVVARHWAEGGAGAAELASQVLRVCETRSPLTFAYPLELPLLQKLELLAERVYHAAGVRCSPAARAAIERLQAAGHGHLPICVAKTPYSFSSDPAQRGAASGHVLELREVRLATGAGFVVMICGELMTMPGLPAAPAAERIDIDEQGQTIGLS